jgi:hypothetical protein
MKKCNNATLFLLTITLFAFCIACNQQTDAGTTSYAIRVPDPIEGVWELSSLYWYLDGDTLYAEPPNGSTHKIYFDGYVMRTSDPDPDSSEWHGYGTYRLSNDVVIETLSSMSLAVKEEFNGEVEFELKTEYGQFFLKQEMPVPLRETIYQYVEEWKKLN